MTSKKLKKLSENDNGQDSDESSSSEEEMASDNEVSCNFLPVCLKYKL